MFFRYNSYTEPGRCDVVEDTACKVGSECFDNMGIIGKFVLEMRKSFETQMLTFSNVQISLVGRNGAKPALVVPIAERTLTARAQMWVLFKRFWVDHHHWSLLTIFFLQYCSSGYCRISIKDVADYSLRYQNRYRYRCRYGYGYGPNGC